MARFHDRAAAEAAAAAFVARHRRNELPSDLELMRVRAPDGGGYPIATLLRDVGLVSSSTEGMRMVKQGAVRIDGNRLEDAGRLLTVGTEALIQVGKRRAARVQIEG